MTQNGIADVAKRRLKALGLREVSVVRRPGYYEAVINGRTYIGSGYKSGAELAYCAYAEWFRGFMGVPLALTYKTWKRSSNYELRRSK